MIKLGKITRTNGVAGQIMYSVKVTYPGEASSNIAFVGSVYGGPIVMVTQSAECFVSDADRFGEFGPAWVRKFFA